jgi:hypothetical protein
LEPAPSCGHHCAGIIVPAERCALPDRAVLHDITSDDYFQQNDNSNRSERDPVPVGLVAL